MYNNEHQPLSSPWETAFQPPRQQRAATEPGGHASRQPYQRGYISPNATEPPDFLRPHPYQQHPQYTQRYPPPPAPSLYPMSYASQMPVYRPRTNTEPGPLQDRYPPLEFPHLPLPNDHIRSHPQQDPRFAPPSKIHMPIPFHNPAHSPPMPPAGILSPAPPMPSSEDDDLALAIAISQSESAKRLQETDTQEELDLARALEESVITFGSPLTSYADLSSETPAPTFNAVAGSSKAPGIHACTTPTIPNDTFARQLAREEEIQQSPKLAAEALRLKTPDTASHEVNDLPKYVRRPTDNDSNTPPAAMTEVNTFFVSNKQTNTDSKAQLEVTRPEEPFPLPQYSRSATMPTSQSSQDSDEVLARQLAAEDAAHSASPHPKARETAVDHSPSLRSSGLSSHSLQEYSTHAAQPTSSDLLRSASTGSSASYTSLPLRDEDNGRPSMSRNASTVSGVSSPMETVREEEHRPPSTFVDVVPSHPTQFIDPQLTEGVSIGFVAPLISSATRPMNMAFPNIISLPYGRCPPLHLQAPNWRRLLLLLARLSGTRLEPTVDALAGNKSELKLRTVIQFVKPQHASNDWRTILWFTVDHPVPPALPGAYRYTCGDVNVLPFSYTLSALPTVLRDGSDTAMAKVFTVPSTEKIPLPTLPITFPNLSMYLQAVLDESRSITDSSIGMRKLSKMVSTCYPDEFGEEAPERRSRATGFIKKVIGLKSTKPKTHSSNEDTFERITPFYADGWGN